jgi:mannose-1-phosphate guanylyltransferase / mannose-6-phosphate isomerase
MKIAPLIAVVLCGGAGSRLWPVSREAAPKPFMPVADGASLLEKTYRRALALGGGVDEKTTELRAILTVTNRDYEYLVSAETAKLGLFAQSTIAQKMLLEPQARNTAPAIAAAAMAVAQQWGNDALMVVMPADHMVADVAKFAQSVQAALTCAAQGQLVTLGIVPTRPDTGFGYIEQGDALPALPGYAVARFVEKPDAITAKQFLADGRYAWNAGLFVFRADTMLEALRTHAPDVARPVAQSISRAVWRGDVLPLDAESFAEAPSISIDYAVMEKAAAIAGSVAVVPAAFDWSDIGSWTAVRDMYGADAQGNTVRADAVLVDSHNVFVQSDKRTIAAVGVQDLLVIDTSDALLIAHPDRAQDVKTVATVLKARNHPTHAYHLTTQRPWGSFTVIEDGAHYKVKRLVVLPGKAISLQRHAKRNEHWVVVSGVATVTKGDEVLTLLADQSTYIRVTWI